MNNISCPKCKSYNTDFNKEKVCYFCLDCQAIWHHYKQDIVSPNNNNPDSSSKDKSSKEES